MNRERRTITMSQARYIRKIPEKAGMEQSTTVSTQCRSTQEQGSEQQGKNTTHLSRVRHTYWRAPVRCTRHTARYSIRNGYPRTTHDQSIRRLRTGMPRNVDLTYQGILSPSIEL